MNRRTLLLGSLGLASGLAGCGEPTAPRTASPGSFGTVRHSKDEWRTRLTKQQFAVLRESATERPYSSTLLDEHRDGVFACAGCDLNLFSSKTKFDSGTGWPSFWDALPGAVGAERDMTLGMARTSLHCNRCDGHLGHVFEDGPRPTGLRYCINGDALRFKPDGTS